MHLLSFSEEPSFDKLKLLYLFSLMLYATVTPVPAFDQTRFLLSKTRSLDDRRNRLQKMANTDESAIEGVATLVPEDLLSRLKFRHPSSRDMPRCYEIEANSYPSDEAASLESLIFRSEHAGQYFQLCTIPHKSAIHGNKDNDIILGFVCSTRCKDFTEESMSKHDPSGRLLAIHSVVVDERFRRRGVAKAMLHYYVKSIIQQEQQNDTVANKIESIVLLAKNNLLGFYVQCGFQVERPSPIVHGKDLWYECSCSTSSLAQKIPHPNQSWFCKTEQFKRPYPEVKPYLEKHKKWMQQLRDEKGYCITSGYRVDAEGKPGGGGLMFLAAKSYQDALEIVLQDPLIVNDCVDWELNGWIGQVGDLQMR